MMRSFLAHCALGAMAFASCDAALAQDTPLSIRNSFRIGDAGVLCTAQNSPGDRRLKNMFDRSYRLTCRDAASAIGTLVAVRRPVQIGQLPSAIASAEISCGAAGEDRIEGVGMAATLSCEDGGVAYRRYAVERDGVTYLVEGLAGYDPALRLALASVVNDRAMPGTVQVAQTEAGDAAAFARVQAGALDPLGARDEAYVRNNSGRFAESGQFFESIADRNRDNAAVLAEALANQGLQQSNLGNFTASRRLFDQAEQSVAQSDGIGQRLLRNYRAIDALNDRNPNGALNALEKPVAPVGGAFDEAQLRQGVINAPLSVQINRENVALQRLGGIQPGLSLAERAELLDAQARAIAGIAALQQSRLPEADRLLDEADRRIAAVRGGRVTSARWLRSEISLERALIAELQGNSGEATAAYDSAIAVIAEAFPDSPALLATEARKAAFLTRTGMPAEAGALYGQVVERSESVQDSGPALRELLAPYFEMLAADGSPQASAAMFRASQVLQRPGVAQTQAVLARQMSEGNDEASSLFRLSLNRTREIARTEAEISRLGDLPAPSDREVLQLENDRQTLAALKADQTALISKLAEFPRYKALTPQSLDLAALQSKLKPGEAYYKLMVVGSDLYGLWIAPDDARSFRIEMGETALSDEVALLRDSIVVEENGQQVTYPFDVERARKLYLALFGPVDEALEKTTHLIFEPDGAMLQLPPQVLVTAQEGVEAYLDRQKARDADPYDYRGVNWLGRGREVSIAVSPRGFTDIRDIAPSEARNPYLGLGTNAVPQSRPTGAVADSCDWPLATWQNPIKSDELYFAEEEFGARNSRVETGAQFSDTALLSDPTLDDYRVLHFATHGLVTAPKPSCPARPALLTSFGGEGSDGLLSFREIFDLKLDADLVILSACDTAGMATVSATREAGVSTGGNYALDGLVRAFVGAGARTVVASHWPVPDDFDATKRLIKGMIDITPGEALGKSLAGAQESLMDDANTSHPFYWAAFIILGDADKPLVRN
ncbi:CHAT domain-containing protein [Qipengyuania sp.]|uniref:CHAT domain-containing protein n=1 Tax=Qipengyuania sp. TaxID=2004515 RepID=UPI0035C7A3B4